MLLKYDTSFQQIIFQPVVLEMDFVLPQDNVICFSSVVLC